VITPVTSTHRVVLMAIERGMLQDLIFDNQALASHRVMAAILGGILRLPPIQQAMASEQMRSRYLVKAQADVVAQPPRPEKRTPGRKLTVRRRVLEQRSPSRCPAGAARRSSRRSA
jgi:hypothetical protein